MKKVININFQGRVVPIEESAYDILKQYVDSLRRFFANEEGRDEIINDIEDRIAELFAEILKKGSTCITDADVETIIGSMGRPEEFESEEANVKSQLGGESAGTGGYQQATADAAPRGRLYRDDNDKMLAGVCGGLANYLRIDSSLVRILYAILAISSFGTFLLLYILLWIILPSRSLERNLIRKRLFRNPDEKVIAGVASGLAAYFNIAIWIPRLIFAFPLVIGIVSSIFRSAFWHYDPFPSIIFGSFGGTLFIIYLILWAVIPEARTASEKLEMKGEKVDLNTIKNTIQEDLKGFGARAEKWGKEFGERAGEWGKEFGESVGNQGARVGSEFGSAAKRGGNTFLNVLGVLIKAFFLVIAGIISFVLITALIFGSIRGFDFIPLKGFILEGFWQNFLVWPTIILFVFLPVIALVTWIVRRIMRVQSGRHHLGWIFGGLWTLGLICAVFLGASIGGSFSKQVSEQFPVSITQPSVPTLTVKLGEEPGRYYPYHIDDEYDGESEMFLLTKDEDSMLIRRVGVEIAKSDDDQFHVFLVKVSRGGTIAQAEERMQQISFNVRQIDSILYLQKGFAIDRQTKFRDQRLAVVIEVPVGKRILLDESLNWYNRFDLGWDNGRFSPSVGYDKRLYSKKLGRVYVMTPTGLERVDKEAGAADVTAPADDSDNRSREEMRRELEEQQRELERKKRELERNDSTYRYRPTATTRVIVDEGSAKVKVTTREKNEYRYHIGDLMMIRFGS